MSEPVICFENVAVSFNQVEVVKDISFELKKSDKIAIIGPSGCGKSTLLKLILGFIKPTSGELWVFGEPMSCMSQKRLKDYFIFVIRRTGKTSI